MTFHNSITRSDYFALTIGRRRERRWIIRSGRPRQQSAGARAQRKYEEVSRNLRGDRGPLRQNAKPIESRDGLVRWGTGS